MNSPARSPSGGRRYRRNPPRWRIKHADCLKALPLLPSESVDAIVTDPPYGLGFMGKDWDAPGDARSFQAWSETWAREALRVLKPGAHLLAFGGTRTFHRLCCALEDAGFEIRDCLCWLYGQGFPKSRNVSLAIDKHNGHPARGRAIPVASTHLPADRYATKAPLTAQPVSSYRARSRAARAWQGWGTALKPGWEPIILARKPMTGTIAANVLAHETGAINVQACRVSFCCSADERTSKRKNRHGEFSSKLRENHIYGTDARAHGNYDPPGRWPANVLLGHTEDCRQTGHARIRSNGHYPASRPQGGLSTIGHKGQQRLPERSTAGETVGCWECTPDCPVRMVGSTARFFYCAKASRAERDAGLHSFQKTPTNDGRRTPIDNPYQRGTTMRANIHPTVKPIALMRWLVRLITPPGGTVLDPFAGSGSTGVAAVLEDVRFLGIERDADYTSIARARIKHWTPPAAPSRERRSAGRPE